MHNRERPKRLPAPIIVHISIYLTLEKIDIRNFKYYLISNIIYASSNILFILFVICFFLSGNILQKHKIKEYVDKLAISINTLTASYEYSRSNTNNLPLALQMQLSDKLETFSGLFITFLESALNFEHFEKKNLPHSSSIFQVIDSQRRVYLNV